MTSACVPARKQRSKPSIILQTRNKLGFFAYPKSFFLNGTNLDRSRLSPYENAAASRVPFLRHRCSAFCPVPRAYAAAERKQPESVGHAIHRTGTREHRIFQSRGSCPERPGSARSDLGQARP